MCLETGIIIHMLGPGEGYNGSNSQSWSALTLVVDMGVLSSEDVSL